ncbi:hypothetical protein ACP70R_006153 [Stipagrostis hirtigluma subsp. patula]
MPCDGTGWPDASRSRMPLAYMSVGFPYAVPAVRPKPTLQTRKAQRTQQQGSRRAGGGVLDGGALAAAFAGCQGVFHAATPVPGDKMDDPEKEMMAPTVKGTRNVLEVFSATNVQKLVVVSSVAAACFDPNWPEDRLKDESCWSDKEICKEIKSWYCLAKTKAEEMALEYGKRNGLHVVTVLPSLVVGPLLQTALINTSIRVFQYIITGGPDTMNNKFWPFVHVHNVDDALLLA